MPAGHAKRADAACIARSIFLQIVADVPDRAVVARIHRGLGVVLPTYDILRSFAFDQQGLAQCQLAQWIIGQPRRETLTGKVRRTSKRVTNADVALPIDRDRKSVV